MNDSRLPPLPHSRDTALSLAKSVLWNRDASTTAATQQDGLALLAEALPWLESDAEHHPDALRNLIARIHAALAAPPKVSTRAGYDAVEVAAEAIEREMHAYATRYARGASASPQVAALSEETIEAIWDGTATRDDRVMAFATELLAATSASPRSA